MGNSKTDSPWKELKSSNKQTNQPMQSSKIANASSSTLPKSKQTPQMTTEMKTVKIMNDLDETKQVMKQNIDKAVMRGENLKELSNKTADLEKGSSLFKKQAVKIKQRTWWLGCKQTLILTLVIAGIGGLMIYFFVFKK